MKIRRWFAPLGMILCLTIFGVWRFQSADAETQPPSAGQNAASAGSAQPATAPEGTKGKPLPVVEVKSAETVDLVKTLELTGTVTPTRTARVASPGEGPVETCPELECMVREGDRVKKGQVLLRIGRDKSAQAQLAAAEQTLRESEAELRRIEQLVRGGAIPGAQLDGARSAFENARAQQARALESAGDYTVRAPWNGIVSKVHVAEGDYVAPRAPLLEIFDTGSLVVRFAVPEAQAIEVRVGQRVNVRLDAHPGKTFPGNIGRVYPQLDEKMRTRTVEATLNEAVELIPGMFARIEVELARIVSAVTVPAEAVLTGPEGEAVAFVLEAGVARKRQVRAGLEKDGRVQILAGIKAGEPVVVAGNENLKEGAPVRTLGEKAP